MSRTPGRVDRKSRAAPLLAIAVLLVVACGDAMVDGTTTSLVTAGSSTTTPATTTTRLPEDAGTTTSVLEAHDGEVIPESTLDEGPTLEPDPDPISDSNSEPEPDPEAELEPDPVADPQSQTVRFTEAIPEKRWGDPAFEVKAEASSGLPVTYRAAGGCRMEGRKVLVEAVGKCTVTAAQSGDDDWQPASRKLSFDIAPAEPVITFADMDVRFTRDLSVDLWASSSPEIPLAYSVVKTDETFNDEPCAIAGGVLVFPDSPIPALSAVCGIEVRAAATSPNFVAPTPVIAHLGVDMPSWDVSIDPVPARISYAESGGMISLTIRERSGDAYGAEVVPGGHCSVEAPVGEEGFLARPHWPSPAGTMAYTVDVTLEDPAGKSDLMCSIRANALPANHYGGQGTDSISFSIVE